MALYSFNVKSINPHLGKGKSAVHCCDYIERRGTEKNNPDKCLEIGNEFLPEFAKGDARKFWSAADQNEREKGQRCKSLIVALPRELKHDQRKTLLQDFIRTHFKDHPTSWAIHDGKNGYNPHAHILVTDRVMGEDKIRLGRKTFFQRNGAKKDPLWGQFGWIKDQRKNWADITNKHLAIAGVLDRVEHRSNKDRGLPEPVLPHMGAYVSYLHETGQYSYVMERILDDKINGRPNKRSDRVLQAIKRSQQQSRTNNYQPTTTNSNIDRTEHQIKRNIREPSKPIQVNNDWVGDQFRQHAERIRKNRENIARSFTGWTRSTVVEFSTVFKWRERSTSKERGSDTQSRKQHDGTTKQADQGIFARARKVFRGSGAAKREIGRSKRKRGEDSGDKVGKKQLVSYFLNNYLAYGNGRSDRLDGLYEFYNSRREQERKLQRDCEARERAEQCKAEEQAARNRQSKLANSQSQLRKVKPRSKGMGR